MCCGVLEIHRTTNKGSYLTAIAVPSAPAAIRTFCQLAVKSGVEHLVLLSGCGEDEAKHCEDIVKNAGVAWTILRSSWFCQNFSEGFIHDLILAGNITLPVGGVREPFVDVDDIADIAVKALTESGHDNQLYELTGPRSMTFLEATSEIAGAAGRPINFTQIPLHDFSAALAEQHVPADAIGLLEYLFTTVLDGRNEQLTNGVQQALGRPARDFKTMWKKRRALGCGDSPAGVKSLNSPLPFLLNDIMPSFERIVVIRRRCVMIFRKYYGLSNDVVLGEFCK